MLRLFLIEGVKERCPRSLRYLVERALPFWNLVYIGFHPFIGFPVNWHDGRHSPVIVDDALHDTPELAGVVSVRVWRDMGVHGASRGQHDVEVVK